MARERSPNRDKAFAIFKEHKGNITNRLIAEMLNEKEKTVSNWKSRDKWNVVLQINSDKNECSTTKNKSSKNNKSNKNNSNETDYKKTNSQNPMARTGNKNAIGNKGGNGAPVGNKYSLKTGEFETIFFDTFDDEEQQLAEQTPIEKMELLKHELQLITVRERRMLKRIHDLKDKETVVATETVSVQEEGEFSTIVHENSLNLINRIEEALTRVQDRKHKLIDSLHKYEMDSFKLKEEENEERDNVLEQMLEGLKDEL